MPVGGVGPSTGVGRAPEGRALSGGAHAQIPAAAAAPQAAVTRRAWSRHVYSRLQTLWPPPHPPPARTPEEKGDDHPYNSDGAPTGELSAPSDRLQDTANNNICLIVRRAEMREPEAPLQSLYYGPLPS